MACIMALLLGAIYFQQGLSQASIQSRVGAISFSMLLMSFIAFDIVLLFPKERDLYTRESQAGLYGASAFFHARCLAELPGHLTAGGAYATIAYWMMGFQNSPMKFAHFFFLCEAVVFAGTSLLIFCGCCARDFEMANNYATVFFCLFMMCPRPAPVASTAPVTRNPHRSRRPLHQQQVDPGRREVDRGRELLQLGHLCGEPLGATRFR